MPILEESLKFVGERSCLNGARLRDEVRSYLLDVLNVRVGEMWSSVFDETGDETFTNTMQVGRSSRELPEFHVLGRKELRDRLIGFTWIELEVSPAVVAGDISSPRVVIGFDMDREFGNEEAHIACVVLKKLIFDSFQESIRKINEMMVDAAHQSKDLTSFLHRAIHSVLVPEFNFESASIFYYEQKTQSLVLGATTGIDRQRNLGLKRSDIRYFVDEKSNTARCWNLGREIVEAKYRSGELSSSAMGESVGIIRSRIYAPLQRWIGRDVSGGGHPIGVLRALNCNRDAGHHPMTVMEATRLRVFCDAASVLTERYVRTLSILHDQERATHGYNTDLAAIRYAAQNIDRWLGRLDESGISKAVFDMVLQEARYRVRDILAVQDNMASQIITVMYHAGSARLVSRKAESILCNQPYTDVILRLVHSKKGMSECYGRRELLLRFNGELKADDAFIRLPALRIAVGSLYLVFRNLAENSIKYSIKGLAPELDISWRLDGGFVEFAFSDKGIGIPRHEHHLVLREGFRGARAQELQLRGNGLGLAVSKAALEAVAGRLIFDSSNVSLCGARFLVRVPVQ